MITTFASQPVYDQTTRTVRAGCGHEARVLLDHRALQDGQDANAVLDGMARAVEEADCRWCELLGWPLDLTGIQPQPESDILPRHGKAS